jgi:hypothetical protein
MLRYGGKRLHVSHTSLEEPQPLRPAWPTSLYQTLIPALPCRSFPRSSNQSCQSRRHLRFSRCRGCLGWRKRTCARKSQLVTILCTAMKGYERRRESALLSQSGTVVMEQDWHWHQCYCNGTQETSGWADAHSFDHLPEEQSAIPFAPHSSCR